MIFYAIVIKVSYEHSLNGQTFEGEVSIVEGESEIDVAEVVMKGYFAHGLDLGESGRVLFEYLSKISWQLIGAGILVVDRPVAFGDRETVEFGKSDGGGTCVEGTLVYDSVISARIFDVFDDDVADLECALSESHFK